MAKVRFRLKEPYKNGNSPIHLILEFNKERVNHATGLDLPPQYWDNKTQRAKKVRAFHYAEFNKILQDFETKIQRRFLELRNDLGRFPTKDEMKKELNVLTNRNQTKPVTLFEFLETIIIERKKDRESEGTSKSNKTLFAHLKEFCQTQKRTTLNFTDITHNFLNAFKNFAFEVKNHNPNSFDKYIRLLKTAMKEAHKRGFHQNQDYQFFSVAKVPTYGIYLSSRNFRKIQRFFT